MNPFRRRTRMTHARRAGAFVAARRSGFTILDLVVGLVVATVVGGAIGGILILVSRAMPQTAAATTPSSVSSARLADEIASELRFATGVAEMTTKSVTFTVPDRDADGAEEKIRFCWGGTVGDPVTREYNGGPAVTILPAASSLEFAYAKRKESRTTNTPPATSTEALLSQFTGWSGVSATSSAHTVTPTSWLTQKVRLDKVSIPANATNLTITRVRVKAKKPLVGGAAFTLGVHPLSAAGATTPAPSPVGTPGTVSLATLTSAFAWVEVVYPDAVFLTIPTEIVIVARGTASNAAQVQFLTSAAAPIDTYAMRWTNDSGGTWAPAPANEKDYDAYIEVWGTYQVPSSTPTTNDTYYLTSVNVDVEGMDADNEGVRATARVLNQPKVVGP